MTNVLQLLDHGYFGSAKQKNIDLVIESFCIQMNRNVHGKNCQNRHGCTHLSDCPDYLNTFCVLSDVHDDNNTTHAAYTNDPIHTPPQSGPAYSSSQTASP
ncbi:hypothetical protein L873DRAFT_1785960 [Choiromyces venosus 120613-1]|uniref:Uncharacterized protein n=1 Tax=Choiromyces venosus 120613-1 TaxID=1336337 RepID=A0A3N4K732_9PEZI|nr:hypothetical protein L873DRAFT_1785960 [Choiromyces venosus 120613-1]